MGLRGGNKTPQMPTTAGTPYPEGYYKVDDTTLGALPPSMMPNVSDVDVDYSSLPPKLYVYYDIGYVSEADYYNKTFNITDNVHGNNFNALQKITANQVAPYLNPPPTMYFLGPTLANRKQVKFLPYGKIPDATKGVGFVSDPNLMSSSGRFEPTKNYDSSIYNNYNVEFHDSIDTIEKQNDQYDVSFGEVRVLDQDGNVVILPYNNAKANITYYQPGSFPFGASTYIPKYEDSVYLSRLTQLSTVSPYESSKTPKGSCEKYKDYPDKQEEYCRTLDSGTCSSTSCCVLLGGSKCVAGNENGPTYKANYGDYLLRNKDSYYHNGQCYGNCT